MNIVETTKKSTPVVPDSPGPPRSRVACLVCGEVGSCPPADNDRVVFECANRAADTPEFGFIDRSARDPRFALFVRRAEAAKPAPAIPARPGREALPPELLAHLDGASPTGRFEPTPALPDLVEILNRAKPGWDAPPAGPTSRRTRHDDQDADQVERRVLAYLARMEPGVAGQHGSAATLKAARAVCWGFNLGEERGFQILADHYNPKCVPPWSETELRRKCRDAMDPRGAKYDRGALKVAEGDRPVKRESRPSKTSTPQPVSQEAAARREAWRKAIAEELGGPRQSARAEDAEYPAGTIDPQERRQSECDGGADCSAASANFYRGPGGIGIRGRRPDPVAARIIGHKPRNRPCRNPGYKPQAGTSERTAGMFAIRKTRCGKCRPCWERRKYAEKSSHVPVALVMATHIWSGTRKEWEVLRKRLERLRDRLGRDAVFPNVKVVQGNDRYFAALSLEAPPELLPTDLGIVAVTREEAARAVASVIDAIPEFGLRKGTHLVRGSDTWVFPDQPPPEPKKASEWRNMTEAPAAILCGDFDEVHRIIEQRAIHVRREEDVSLAVEDSIEFSLPIGSEREVFRSIFGRSWEGLPGGPDPDDGGPFGDPNFWSEPNPRQEALV